MGGHGVTKDRLKKLLEDVAAGTATTASAYEKLRSLPFEDLGMANVDHHRAIRQGIPEVILGEGKTAAQIVAIAKAMRREGHDVLVTRIDAGRQAAVRKAFRGAAIHAEARCA